MQPIPNNLSVIKHRPGAAANGSNPTGGGAGFSQQLQSLLQQTQTPAQSTGPSMATTGTGTASGGMNDSAHRLLKLAGKG